VTPRKLKRLIVILPACLLLMMVFCQTLIVGLMTVFSLMMLILLAVSNIIKVMIHMKSSNTADPHLIFKTFKVFISQAIECSI